MKNSVIIFGLFLAGQFLFSALAFGTIVNVPNDYGSIQDGINAAFNGDTVHIEASTYIGAGNRSLSIPFGRNIVIRGEGPDATIIDLQSLSFDGFVFDYTQEDNSTIIRDLSVRNARKGLHLVETGPRLVNLKLVNNIQGIYHAMPFGIIRVEHCQFINNDTGIASYANNPTTFVIDSSSFINNDYGIFGTVQINYSEITGGISGIGCRMVNSGPGATFVANNCDLHSIGDTAIHVGFFSAFNNCNIQNNIGTIAFGAPSNPNTSNLYLHGCRIDNNAEGIKIEGYNTTIEMTDTRYTHNSLPVKYGCQNAGGWLIIDGCLFLNNVSDALLIGGWPSDVNIHHSIFGMGGATGSAIVVDTLLSNLNIYSTTISQFRDYGILIREIDGDLHIDSTLVVNNINYGIYMTGGVTGSTNISCNDVWNNTAGNYGGLLSDMSGSNGNVSLDPQFCDSTTGDFHVLPASPCSPVNNSCNTVIGGLGVGCYQLQPLIVTGYSSEINMTVIDPDGYYIGKDAGGTLHQTLFPADYNLDGPATDQITVYYPISGTYIIEVVGQLAAMTRGSYAVGIRIDGTDETKITANTEVPDPGESDTYGYVVEEGWHFLNGDADRNETINILDIVYLINYVYKNGPEPYPLVAGEADCNAAINILDIVYLINYIYKNGPEPCQILP